MKPVTNLGFLKHVPKKARNHRRPVLKNSLLKVKTLHSSNPSEGEIRNSANGVVNTKFQNSVTHAPSLYYWLSTKCGIPLDESNQLFQQKRLFLDGSPIENEKVLMAQHMWNDVEKMDLRVLPGRLKTGHLSEEQLKRVEPVPVLHRARHRSYKLWNIHRQCSLNPNTTDPLSFVHRAKFPAESQVHLLHHPWHVRGMHGVVIATDDAMMSWRWSSKDLGNFGRVRYHFMRGVPQEMLDSFAGTIKKYIETHPMNPDVMMPGFEANVSLETATWTPRTEEEARSKKPFEYPVLDVAAPLIPKRMHRPIARQAARVEVAQCGPFALPSDLPQGRSRPLHPEELQALFEYDRKLKTNQLVLSLREVTEDDEGSTME